MFESILNGERPSKILNAMLADDPTLDKGDLACFLMEEFTGIDSAVFELVTRWSGGLQWKGRPPGVSDDLLDYHLKEMLTEAGYL